MGRKKVYDVKLSQAERDHLKNLVSNGSAPARKLTQARIFFNADEAWKNDAISAALDVGLATVGRIRRKYVEAGLVIAPTGKSRVRQFERKIDDKTEAHLIALLCGDPPTAYGSRGTCKLYMFFDNA